MRKFAIIRRNGLGDFVSATVPLCSYIKNVYQNAEIHLFMSEQNNHLASYFDLGDHVHVIPNGNKYIQTLLTAIRFRKLSFDVGIAPVPAYPKLNNIFLKTLNATFRYGPKCKMRGGAVG